MMNVNRSRRLPRGVAWISALALTLGAFDASAQRIYVNDVDVTTAQLKNWTLARVEKVEFDDEGNVRISAPSYSVQVVPQPSAGAAGSAPGSTPANTAPRTTTPTAGTPASGTSPQAQGSAASRPAPGTPAATPTESAPVTIYYEAEVSMAHRYLLVLSNPERGSVPYDVDILVNGKHVVTYTHQRGNSAIDVSEHVQQGQNTVSFAARRPAGASAGNPNATMSIMLGVGAYDGAAARFEHVLLGMEYRGSDTRSVVRNSLTFRVQ